MPLITGTLHGTKFRDVTYDVTAYKHAGGALSEDNLYIFAVFESRLHSSTTTRAPGSTPANICEYVKEINYDYHGNDIECGKRHDLAAMT
jgi:hypothetical protein